LHLHFHVSAQLISMHLLAQGSAITFSGSPQSGPGPRFVLLAFFTPA
jgi:hypothetical protein